jgi:hypothetical protein
MIELILALATAPFVMFLVFLGTVCIVVDFADRCGFFGRKS